MSVRLLVERQVTELGLVDVDLTLLGGQERADCPFCEAADTFAVAEDGVFYCFGCGATGAVCA